MSNCQEMCNCRIKNMRLNCIKMTKSDEKEDEILRGMSVCNQIVKITLYLHTICAIRFSQIYTVLTIVFFKPIISQVGRNYPLLFWYEPSRCVLR
jgi:hypothetical protein